MKKMIMIILVLLLALPINLIGYAASDTTPPKLIKATINKHEVRDGDVLRITFELAPDLESGLNEDGHSGQIRLRHSSGTLIASVNQYIGNNKYEFKWDIEAINMMSGKWFVESVQFSDNANNKSSYHYQDHAVLKDLYFSFKDGIAEPEKPVLNGITIQTPETSPGHAIRVNLDITDPSDALHRGYVRFRHKLTDASITAYLRKKQSGNGWEATAAIDQNIKNGDWYVQFVNLTGNHFSVNYHPEDYPFLKYKKFIVSGGINDFNKPIFNSVELPKSSIQVGDSFDIYVDAKDLETGLEDVSVTLQNKKTSHVISSSDLWEVIDGKYKMKINVPITQMPGQYEIKQIYLRDKVGNDAFIMNQNFPEVTIHSIFNGTDGDVNNIITGSNFEPLQNVKAISNYEGDLTDDIKYTGTVDTQTKGVYLITYSVSSKKENYTYKDYRWLSVNDEKTLEHNVQATTAYFKSDIDVVVPEDAHVSLKSENKNIEVNGKAKLTSEGIYTATVSSPQARAVVSNNISSNNQFNIVIDRTLPTNKLNTVTTASTSVMGQTEPFAKVIVKINNKSFEGKANSTGKFGVTIPKQKVNTVMTIQSKDLAGNVSKQTNSKVVLPLTLKPVSNLSTTVYGQSLPYANVKLYISGKYVKQTKVTSKGSYKFAIVKQSAGRDVKVEVITKDAKTSANTKVSDKIAPAIQSIDNVTSNSIYVSGKTEKYAKIRVDWIEYQGVIAEGKALSNGTFKVKIQKLKKGSTLRIYVIDAAGNESYKIIKVK